MSFTGFHYQIGALPIHCYCTFHTLCTLLVMLPWLLMITLQVPFPSVCGGHLLLFCGDDVCSDRNPEPFQQNNASLLHTANHQLCLLHSSAVRSHTMPATPPTKVRCCCVLVSLLIVVADTRLCLLRFNSSTGLLGMSRVQFHPSQIGTLGSTILTVLSTLKLVAMETNVGDKKDEVRINNLTLINLVLKWAGPTHERTLVIYMLIIQVRPLPFLPSESSFPSVPPPLLPCLSLSPPPPPPLRC